MQLNGENFSILEFSPNSGFSLYPCALFLSSDEESSSNITAPDHDHSMIKSSSMCLRCSDEEGAPGQLLSVNNIGESTILTSDLFLTAAFGKVTILIKAQLGILLV